MFGIKDKQGNVVNNDSARVEMDKPDEQLLASDTMSNVLSTVAGWKAVLLELFFFQRCRSTMAVTTKIWKKWRKFVQN